MKDTPDTVDLQLLADSSDGFDGAVDVLNGTKPEDFAVVDPTLWTADVTTTSGAMFTIDATVRDGSGAPQANANAAVSIMYDDFFQATTARAMTDANGHVQFQLDASTVTMGSGNRFLHVTAGPTYPLVEHIVPLP
jgi:hypothetical protein